MSKIIHGINLSNLKLLWLIFRMRRNTLQLHEVSGEVGRLIYFFSKNTKLELGKGWEVFKPYFIYGFHLKTTFYVKGSCLKAQVNITLMGLMQCLLRSASCRREGNKRFKLRLKKKKFSKNSQRNYFVMFLKLDLINLF